MVAEAMAKIVFLLVPVCSPVFPLGKVNFRLFFTVKHIFFKIKLWTKEMALEKWKGKEAFNYEEA
jgi:hypothetical protein